MKKPRSHVDVDILRGFLNHILRVLRSSRDVQKAFETNEESIWIKTHRIYEPAGDD